MKLTSKQTFLWLIILQFALGLLLTGFFIPFESLLNLLFPYSTFIAPVCIVLLIFIKKEDDIKSRTSTKLMVWFLLWVLVQIVKLGVFLNRDYHYPNNASFIELGLNYSSWMVAGILISKNDIVKKNIIHLVLFIELLFIVFQYERIFLLYFIISVLLFYNDKVLVHKLVYYFLIIGIISISIVYIRTVKVSNDVSLTVSEFKSVVRNSVERLTIVYQSDSRIIDSDIQYELSELSTSFTPRFIDPDKPSFTPGLQIKHDFWPEITKKNQHIPVGFVGSHKLYFGNYFLLTLLVHGVLIAILLWIILKKWSGLELYLWLVFVYVHFCIPEHSIFYVTSWLRILPFYGIIFLIIKLVSSKSNSIHYLLSTSTGFGGIQRVNTLIINYLNKHYYPLVIHTFNGISLWDKIRYSFNVLTSISCSDILIMSHLQFLKITKILPFRIRTIVFTHGIEITMSAKKYVNKDVILYANSKKTAERFGDFTGVIHQHNYPFLWVGKSETKENNENNENKQIVLSVGRLSKQDSYKQYDMLIQAFAPVANQVPDALLVIVGEGELKQELIQLSKQLTIEKQVLFTGFVSDNELSSWYRKASVFVLPSTQEGQGLVYYEAMSAGVPVIGIRETVLEEFIQDGKEGFLCENSVLSLQEKISLLVYNPQLCIEMGEKAYETVSLMNQTLSLYNQLEKDLAYVQHSRQN